MGTRLYVGNIPYGTTDVDLRGLFGQNGRAVTEVKIVTDRDTGQSRGFAFVEMANNDDAQAAITELNGSNMGGRSIVVNEARERAAGGGPGGPGGFRPGPRPGGPPGGPGGFRSGPPGGPGGFRSGPPGGPGGFRSGGPGGGGPGGFGARRPGGPPSTSTDRDGGKRRSKSDRDREREKKKSNYGDDY